MYEIITDEAAQPTELASVRWALEGHNGCLGGGFYKDLVRGKAPRDIDLWFAAEKDFDAACAYYRGNKECFEMGTTKNAVSFYSPVHGCTVEVIRHRFGSPQAIVQGFDYIAAKLVYYRIGDTYVVHQHRDVRKHIVENVLDYDDTSIINGGVLKRLIKYVSYGFKPTQRLQARIVEAIRFGKIDASNESY